MAIDTVIFDLDGTLVEHGHALLPPLLAEWGYPRSYDAVKEAVARQIHYFYNHVGAAEEQGRVEAEMTAASGIQLSMLPQPFATRHGDERRVDVAGLLEPAGDVGGDFYDFELVGGRYIYIAVGDVAGSGRWVTGDVW